MMLDALKNMLKVFEQEELQVYCCGGAARDIAHGVVPKDFDLCVIQGDAESEPVEDTADRMIRLLSKYGAQKIVLFHSYRGSPAGRLAYVIKFEYQGYDFDLIEYMDYIGSPEEQVREFDCTLNAVWLELMDGDTLRIRTTPEFDAVRFHGKPVQAFKGRLDGDINERFEYLRQKYPQYTFDTVNPYQEPVCDPFVKG